MKSPFTGKEMAVKTGRREIVFRKETFLVNFQFYLCEETGEEFTDSRLGDLNMNQVFNQFRKKHKLPFPDEIKLLRDKYELSASKMAEALGFGTNVYRNYENGEIPSASNSRLIQLAKDPAEFKKLVELSGAFEGRDLKKIIDRLNKLIEEERRLYSYSVQDVVMGRSDANEFTGYKAPNMDKALEMIVYFTHEMTRGNKLWKTKMNKLLFYADFCHFKNYGNSISGLEYRAIQRGPVPSKFASLYEYAACNDFVDIYYTELSDGNLGEMFEPNDKRGFESDKFSESELEVLEEVSKRFSNVSTQEIVNLSHEEIAWQMNYESKALIDYNLAFELKNLKQ